MVRVLTSRQATQADQRARLLEVARRTLEEAGPDGLRARTLTAEIGASTQAVYTLFGGMPGLFEALVVDGFRALTDHVRAVEPTDDPVADFFAQGFAYSTWALANPQLYRLMFGLAAGTQHVQRGLQLTLDGKLANFPEGQAASEVMVHALARVREAGRLGDNDPVLAAGQFLSATHGFVLLAIGGAFGAETDATQVAAEVGINLMIGLGDARAACERSLEAGFARFGVSRPRSR